MWKSEKLMTRGAAHKPLTNNCFLLKQPSTWLITFPCTLLSTDVQLYVNFPWLRLETILDTNDCQMNIESTHFIIVMFSWKNQGAIFFILHLPSSETSPTTPHSNPYNVYHFPFCTWIFFYVNCFINIVIIIGWFNSSIMILRKPLRDLEIKLIQRNFQVEPR